MAMANQDDQVNLQRCGKRSGCPSCEEVRLVAAAVSADKRERTRQFDAIIAIMVELQVGLRRKPRRLAKLGKLLSVAESWEPRSVHVL